MKSKISLNLKTRLPPNRHARIGNTPRLNLFLIVFSEIDSISAVVPTERSRSLQFGQSFVFFGLLMVDPKKKVVFLQSLALATSL
jgi:hypothetical protein